MRILISGASGLVGNALTKALGQCGHSVAHLVRPGRPLSEGDVRWDPAAATVDVSGMEGADAVVHLSGAGIADGRWTGRRKAILRSSRLDSTRVLVNALARMRQRPTVFVCASAVGYYGDRGNEVLTESSTPGRDFLALLARDWEAEALRAESGGTRTVLLRFGIILSAQAGALPRMLMPFKFFLGGRLGRGDQWMSWIGLEDAVTIARQAIEKGDLSGPLNVVAPNPVQNAEFTETARRVLHRPAVLRIPASALRLALGEMAHPLLLASQRVIPARLITMGHPFRCERLEPALTKILATA